MRRGYTTPGATAPHIVPWSRRGKDCLQCHMTNTLNTPAEALEMQYPLRVRLLTVKEVAARLRVCTATVS